VPKSKEKKKLRRKDSGLNRKKEKGRKEKLRKGVLRRSD